MRTEKSYKKEIENYTQKQTHYSTVKNTCQYIRAVFSATHKELETLPPSFTHFFTEGKNLPARTMPFRFALLALYLAMAGCAPHAQPEGNARAEREVPAVAIPATPDPTASIPAVAERAASNPAMADLAAPTPGAPHLRHLLAFGTVVTLRAEGEGAAAALDESTARLRALDALFDAAQPTSDIAQLNEAAGGAPIPIAPETQRLFAHAQAYAEKTDGAWDITIGPLRRLWQEALSAQRVPTKDEIEAARALVDWRKLEITPEGHARLKEPGMSLDVGGAVKGQAADEVRGIFAAHHIENGLISLGESTLCALGESPAHRPWQIALKHPRQAPPARAAVLSLTDAILSTSGDYEHFFIAEGRRYHHLLDPRTGWPRETDVASVVLTLPATAPDAGLTSDILSTALFLLAPDGASLLPDGASALLIAPDGTLTALEAPAH